jgi:hypothetical protein
MAQFEQYGRLLSDAFQPTKLPRVANLRQPISNSYGNVVHLKNALQSNRALSILNRQFAPSVYLARYAFEAALRLA